MGGRSTRSRTTLSAKNLLRTEQLDRGLRCATWVLFASGVCRVGVTRGGNERCHAYFFLKKTDDFLVIAVCKVMTFLAVQSRSSTVLSKFSHIFFIRASPPWRVSPGSAAPRATVIYTLLLHVYLTKWRCILSGTQTGRQNSRHWSRNTGRQSYQRGTSHSQGLLQIRNSYYDLCREQYTTKLPVVHVDIVSRISTAMLHNFANANCDSFYEELEQLL